MSAAANICMLSDYDDEDVFDVIQQLETSFRLKFDKKAFYDVKTLGDLIDVFDIYLHYDDRSDCTTQQAFYKIRKAVADLQRVDKSFIKPETTLKSLFPKTDRRKNVRALKSQLGISFRLLTFSDELSYVFVGGFLLSIILLFFSWTFALLVFAISISGIMTASYFAATFIQETAGDLAKNFQTINYVIARRRRGTMNKAEIITIIIESFSNHFDIDPKLPTRDAKFSWANS